MKWDWEEREDVQTLTTADSVLTSSEMVLKVMKTLCSWYKLSYSDMFITTPSYTSHSRSKHNKMIRSAGSWELIWVRVLDGFCSDRPSSLMWNTTSPLIQLQICLVWTSTQWNKVFFLDQNVAYCVFKQYIWVDFDWTLSLICCFASDPQERAGAHLEQQHSFPPPHTEETETSTWTLVSNPII